MSARNGSGDPPGRHPGGPNGSPEPLRLAIGDVDGIRAELVASLRARIERGEYFVPPELVARAVLREIVADLLT